MAKGSKPRQRLVDDVAGVDQETVELDDRGRLAIPSGLAKWLPWLSPAGSGGSVALAILRDPGKVELRSWATHEAAVLVRRDELIRSGNLRDLRLLEDVCRRLPIPQELRLTLDRSMIVHLGLQLPLPQETILFIARVGEALEIFSPAHRDRELARARSVFFELLE